MGANNSFYNHEGTRAFMDFTKKFCQTQAHTNYFNKCRKKYNFEKIPKICYQTWETYDLPQEIIRLRTKNKDINPDIEFKLYNDKDCEEFIKNNFSERVYNAYKQINLGVVKSDFWRYCILFINGGIYLDVKSKLDKKIFNNIIKEDDICLLDIKRSTVEFFRINEMLNSCRNQWLLIFCKGHPYLKQMIDTLVTNILQNNICVSYNELLHNIIPGIANKKKEQILRLSGPDAFSLAVDTVVLHVGLLHRDVDYNTFAKIAPIGRPMYNNINKHYSKKKESILHL